MSQTAPGAGSDLTLAQGNCDLSVTASGWLAD